MADSNAQVQCKEAREPAATLSGAWVVLLLNANSRISLLSCILGALLAKCLVHKLLAV
jgi:hypothetical protein